MNRNVLIVLVVIVIAALGWLAFQSKTPEPTVPDAITIRGTIMDPVDITPDTKVIKVQNYDDLSEWTVNLTPAIDQNTSALRYSQTVSVSGHKTGEKTIDATSIAEESLPGVAVTKPAQNDNVDFPLIVEGKGRAFENTIGIIIKDSVGNTLAETSTMVDAPNAGLFGNFHAEITYNTPKTATGTVEVFEASAKDGSRVNPVIVPIEFKQIEISEVKVFFGSRVEDPDTLHCETVYSVVRRVEKTTAIAQAALSELIKGPTTNESLAGSLTNIPVGTKLNAIKIENGIATADFNATLDPHGGSCRVQAIRAQIEKTLLQFPTVKKVVITIDGKSTGILQP